MRSYVINDETLAIIPVDHNRSKVYEKTGSIIVNKPTMKLIEENCTYYGSTYAGRKEGTAKLIGITHKPPILIKNYADSDNLIFFPTCSPRIKECGWIALNNIKDYSPYEEDSIIRFSNNLRLEVPVSSKILNNQILKSSRLDSVIRKRQRELENLDKKHKNT